MDEGLLVYFEIFERNGVVKKRWGKVLPLRAIACQLSPRGTEGRCSRWCPDGLEYSSLGVDESLRDTSVGRRGDESQDSPDASPRGSGRLRDRKGHAAGGRPPLMTTSAHMPASCPVRSHRLACATLP